MPALNTPQFSWVKSRLPRKPQPVPPIFQPEVAARAVVWAAHHPRREYYVGAPTLGAIWANKLFPGLLDRYLGRTGYDAQQYDGADDPGRADNLWAPVPGDHGAHGQFGKRAHAHSLELVASTHRTAVAISGMVLAIGIGAWRLRQSAAPRLPWPFST